MRKRLLFAALAVGSVGALAAGACVGNDDPNATSNDGGGGSTTDTGTSTTTDSGAGATDSGGSSPDADAGPSNFCSTVSAPDGAADYTCADFDEANVGLGFSDASVTDGSVLSATALAAFSTPNGLLAQAAAANPDEQTAYLEWTKAGAQPLQTIGVTLELNPTLFSVMVPFAGAIFLTGIRTTNEQIDLGYANGDTIGDAGSYRGYFVHVRFLAGDELVQANYPISDLTQNMWTSVSLGFDYTTGAIGVAFGKTTTVTVPGFAVTETLADAYVGGDTVGTTLSLGWRYDNVQIATTRAP